MGRGVAGRSWVPPLLAAPPPETFPGHRFPSSLPASVSPRLAPSGAHNSSRGTEEPERQAPHARLELTSPIRLPRGIQVNRHRFSPGVGCWQVFGLASAATFVAFLSPAASRPKWPVHVAGFVLAYRCGAAPELHRVPSWPRIPFRLLGTSTNHTIEWCFERSQTRCCGRWRSCRSANRHGSRQDPDLTGWANSRSHAKAR
jgi:hypothetical protein